MTGAGEAEEAEQQHRGQADQKRQQQKRLGCLGSHPGQARPRRKASASESQTQRGRMAGLRRYRAAEP